MNDVVLLACTIGDLSWLRRGVSEGLDPCTKNTEGLNGLHLAAKSGRVECMQYLLDNCSIGVNDQATSSGSTALHYCLSPSNGAKKILQCMKLLLERGANKNRQNMSGQTALHLAARIGHAKCLRTLLEHGADISIMDKDGRTAYNIACLHSHHECARLLQALHWASEKDTSTNRRMREETMRQNREQEMNALHTRLKKEVADAAYDDWLEKNNATHVGVHPPTECETRWEVRSQPGGTFNCSTCSHVASQRQSATTTHHRHKRVTPIKLAVRQEKRNIGSVGKPDKIYPYANYPPESMRTHVSSRNSGRGSAMKSSSGKTSRVTSTRTRGSGVKYCHRKKQQHQTTAKTNGTVPSYANRSIEDQTAQTTVSQVPGGKVEDNVLSNGDLFPVVHDTKKSDSNRQQQEETPFTPVDLEDSEDLDDDFAFHDVGHANSLDALSLPSSLMKGRTPAEAVQLLRLFGTPRPRPYKRSVSYSQPSNKSRFQRRFSLGAIPEGEIVTTYSDEDASTSQLFYHNFKMYSIGREMGDDHKLAEDEFEASGSEELASFSDESEDAFEGYRAGDHPYTRPWYTSMSDSVLLEKREQAEPPKLNSIRRLSVPQSLSIVNFAWDSQSNTVQSHVVISPMSTPDHKQTKTHRVTSLGFRTQSLGEISPRSHSQYKARTLSRSPSPQDPPKMLPPHSITSSRENPSHTQISNSPTVGHFYPPVIPLEIPSSQSTQAPSVSQTGPNFNISPIPHVMSPTPTPSPLSTSLSPTSPKVTNPDSSPEMEPASLLPNSLFSVCSLASKSMVLSGPETDRNQPILHMRVKSAPALNISVQSKTDSKTTVLKTAVFEFGGTLKHS